MLQDSRLPEEESCILHPPSLSWQPVCCHTATVCEYLSNLLFTKKDYLSVVSFFEILFQTQAQFCTESSVAFDVFATEIVQHVSALANHFQQAAAGMMVFLVGLQMFGKESDSLGEDSNLYFRRSGIAFVDCIGVNDFFFCFSC